MKKTITHAGCVAFREEAGEKRRFLIVSSSSGEHWVLPKGHLEEGETPEETALRELEEEAGVLGEILRPLTIENHYKKSGKEVVIQYFLVRGVGTVKPMEKRKVRWLAKKTALELLSFEDARSVLQSASDFLKKGT